MALLNCRDCQSQVPLLGCNRGKARPSLSELLEDGTGDALALSLNLLRTQGLREAQQILGSYKN